MGAVAVHASCLVIVLSLLQAMPARTDLHSTTDLEKRKQELGRRLFFDARLSEPQGISCASCHAPSTAFADPGNAVVSRGSRQDVIGSRNTPSISYAMYTPALHYNAIDSTHVGGLFWDGRANSLHEQAREPLFDAREMNNEAVHDLVLKVKGAGYYDELVSLYGPLDGDDGLLHHLLDAIAAFERSAEVNPFSSKFDAYLRGEVSLDPLEAEGMALFKDTARAQCASCHTMEPDPVHGRVLFTDHTYDNIGVPRRPNGVDPDASTTVGELADVGLEATTGMAGARGQFRVPTLRNVAVTAPYFHNGSFSTLEEVVHFYNARDVDPTIGAPEVPFNVNGDELGDLKLTEAEEEAIVAFLRTLTDGYRPAGTAR
jgi:cytochrome c peroxidase